MALLFHQAKVAPSVKSVCWMKIVNKTSFEHGAPPGVISAFYEHSAPPGVNKYRTPPGVISSFYKLTPS